MPVRASIEPLGWESRFFALPSALLRLADDAPLLATGQLAGYARVQAKIPAHRHDWLDSLQTLGFRLVESEADFVLPVPVAAAHSGVLTGEEANGEKTLTALARHEDIPLLRDMAAQAFRHSRFRPPWYAPGDSERFYACWVENAVLGCFDDQCVMLWQQPLSDMTASNSGQPCVNLPTGHRHCSGFVTLRQLDEQRARIGLLAGRGVGAQLMTAAKQWCAQRGLSQLMVATQAANLAAMRRYAQSGGTLQSMAYWLYK